MRIAPKGGYNFPNKRQYRRDVWSQFRRNCPVTRRDAVCVLMPSLEGAEIDTALAAGFNENNLHIVDREPAVVATLRRRYGRIHTHGINIARMAERLPPRSVHLANLDLCGSLTDQLFAIVRAFAPLMADDGVIAVSMLRGREHGRGRQATLNARSADFGADDTGAPLSSDDWRETLLTHEMEEALALDPTRRSSCSDCEPYCLIEGLRVGKYRSSAGTQTMLYVISRVMGQDSLARLAHSQELIPHGPLGLARLRELAALHPGAFPTLKPLLAVRA